MSEPNEIEFKNLWRRQATQVGNTELEAVRANVDKYQRGIRIRNAIEYIPAAIAVVVFSRTAIFNLDRQNFIAATSDALIVAAILFIVCYLRKHGRTASPPVDHDVRNYLMYLSRDIARHRDLSKNIFWWYQAPFVPGLLLSAIEGMIHPSPKLTIPPVIMLAIYLTFMLLVFIGGYWWSQRTAARLQHGIDQAKAALQSFEQEDGR